MRNPIQWWQRWRMIRKNRRESDAISKQQHEEALQQSRRACLAGAFDEIEASLTKIGFKVSENRARADDYTSATAIAVAPNGVAYRLVVFNRGGYRLESI